MEAIKALLAQITAFWASKDKRFKRNAIIIASSVLAVVIIVSVLLNQVDYATLYTGLDAADSAAVMKSLTDQKVLYKVSGTSILVPAKDADRLRLTLSTQVKNGFSLDILNQGNGLGMTEADKQQYRKYQLQLDIQNAIKTCEGVNDARVALTIPDDSPLVITANRQEATAGVILFLNSGVELSQDQIKAIASFVKNSVTGLKLENISMMDSTMRNLDITSSDDTDISTKDQFKLQDEVRTQFRKQVMNLLQPVFGLGRVEAEVNVELNFDSKTTDTVKFEPVVGDSGIVVSIDKLREQIVNGSAPGASGQPGTTTNTGTTTYPVVSVENGTYQKNADTINYEISSTKDHLEAAKGSIKNLSVSVVVDNTGLKEDYTANVKSLVATALGVSQDLVSVAFLPMLGTQAISDELAKSASLAQAQQKAQQNQFYIIVGAVLLVLLLPILLVFAGKRSKAKAELALQRAALLGPEPVASPQEESMEEQDQTDDGLAAIRIVNDSSAKDQIGKLIERNPELVANLLRTWLADEEE